MNDHPLKGLNAENPLGFLAALGLLRVLDDNARRSSLERPRLAFADAGNPVARIVTPLDRAGVCAAILDDARLMSDDPVLRLAYDDDGNEVAADGKDATRDLKPPPRLARKSLLSASRLPRRSADMAAGLFSDVVQDNNGNTKPTALHFTAGNQLFLEMVDSLRSGLDRGHINEALDGPWQSACKLPSLSWDSTAARQYALRASDPAKQKRGSVAAANWLGAVGLTLLPVVARGTALRTTGVTGGWKNGSFTWPLWETPAALATVRSLLSLDWSGASRAEREAVKVVGVIRCRILRSEQGGYGSFSPAETVLAD